MALTEEQIIKRFQRKPDLHDSEVDEGHEINAIYDKVNHNEHQKQGGYTSEQRYNFDRLNSRQNDVQPSWSKNPHYMNRELQQASNYIPNHVRQWQYTNQNPNHQPKGRNQVSSQTVFNKSTGKNINRTNAKYNGRFEGPRGMPACWTCGDTSHFAASCPISNRRNWERRSCWTCGLQGHIARNCHKNFETRRY